MAGTTSRAESYAFTFKPKLNEKSTEIAQTLLSDFHQRQIRHTQRLQQLKDLAAVNYREWYCGDRRSITQLELHRSVSDDHSAVDEDASVEEKETPAVRVKENQFNNRIVQLLQAYGSSLPKRTKIPAILLPKRSIKRPTPRSAPPLGGPKEAESAFEETKESVSLPPPPPAPVLAPIVIRPTRRAPVLVRSRSDVKPIRRLESPIKRPVFNDNINPERLKLARDEAERAMKEHKIFTIIGEYPALRDSLRRRGWVERFDRALLFPSVPEKKKSDKKNSKSDDDDDNDDDDGVIGDTDLDETPLENEENGTPPWEENDGYYGILSRLVKSAVPDLVWTVQATYDTSTLNKDQMVNHFERNGCLTTKVGLCSSLKSLPWFHSGCADEFYPRCYKLTHDDERTAFIEDYRLTTCISFLKLVRNRCKGILEPNTNSSLDMSLSQSSLKKVSSSFIEFALDKVEQFTMAREHEDIDIKLTSRMESTDQQWKQFIEQFYAASHSYAEIDDMKTHLSRIEQCLKNVEQHCPQYHIDGTRNIWISKPGAMSRGRGIVVYDRLDDMLKLCSSTVTDKAKFIVQKYIERPLLIHNVKFDIRQWFLVTDWNPLTIWMYKDSYFRFCTEHFSLATRQQNVHLCNYAIQKHFKNNVSRHADLPAENMWRSSEFIQKYLRPKKLAGKWDSFIYPAMKEAIICSMLVAQDTIDTRKNSFELFGADFMLGEDLQPWLIEINCSPTMARCTSVTTEMCDAVLEDTCKVIIDRKYDRSEDTGRFELIHKGIPVAVPNYVGINLRVEGKHYKTDHINVTRTENANGKSALLASTVADNSASKVSPAVQQSTVPTKNRQATHPSTNTQKSTASMYQTSEKSFVSSKNTKPQTNLITVDLLPIGPLSRPQTNDPLPLTKVLEDKESDGLKTDDDEMKSTGTLPFLRRLQNSLWPQKNKEQKETDSDPKTLQGQSTNLNSTTFDAASSVPALSMIEPPNEHLTVISVA